MIYFIRPNNIRNITIMMIILKILNIMNYFLQVLFFVLYKIKQLL